MVWALLVGGNWPGLVRAAGGLPVPGENTLTVVSTVREQAMGREFIAAARERFAFVDDPLLLDYVTALGRRLAGYLGGDTAGLRFYLINSPRINAFAAPGGRLAVFTGLLAATQNEGELASVLAHELAHVVQRHLPRLLERAERVQIPATVGMLAAILLGGQAGVAAMVTTSAAVAADQLRYSREFEREADALGLKILTGAGFTSAGMVSFLERLEQQTRMQSAAPPEYLHSHPLSQNRLAAIESRAAPEVRPVAQSLDFLHARARMLALFSENIRHTAAEFKHQGQAAEPAAARAAQYGLALIELHQGEAQHAIELSRELTSAYPTYPPYRIALAEALLAAGKGSEAVDVLSETWTSMQADPTLAYYLADVLLKTGARAQARPVLRAGLRAASSSAVLYRLLARVEGELGRPAPAFQALAEYHYWRDEYNLALEKLQRAAALVDTSAYLEASIAARTRAIQAELALAAD